MIKMADPDQIQAVIDHCTQTANTLRSEANSMLCAMNRQSITLGAAHIEMCINACVQAKTLKS